MKLASVKATFDVCLGLGNVASDGFGDSVLKASYKRLLQFYLELASLFLFRLQTTHASLRYFKVNPYGIYRVRCIAGKRLIVDYAAGRSEAQAGNPY
jgi:hypothetical protein